MNRKFELRTGGPTDITVENKQRQRNMKRHEFQTSCYLLLAIARITTATSIILSYSTGGQY